MFQTRVQRAVVVAVAAAAVLSVLAGGAFLAMVPLEEQAARLTVVASFFPLYEFATLLVGTDVEVRILVPPGVEPHDWEPRPGDLSVVAEADLLIYIHPEFETYVPSLLAAVPAPPATAVMSEGLELLLWQQGSEVVIDPHIWLDPLLIEHQVLLIRDALIRIDPGHESDYRLRASFLLAKLERLHEDFVEGLSLCEVRTFIASHAAFTYFALRYDLTLEPITRNPEVGPSLGRIQELIDYARAHDLKVIYTEPLLAGGTAQVIAEEIGGTTLPLDPVEGSTSKGSTVRTYFSIMRDNLDNLRVGLRCSP